MMGIHQICEARTNTSAAAPSSGRPLHEFLSVHFIYFSTVVKVIIGYPDSFFVASDCGLYCVGSKKMIERRMPFANKWKNQPFNLQLVGGTFFPKFGLREDSNSKDIFCCIKSRKKDDLLEKFSWR
jgi:hypothetical protein